MIFSLGSEGCFYANSRNGVDFFFKTRLIYLEALTGRYFTNLITMEIYTVVKIQTKIKKILGSSTKSMLCLVEHTGSSDGLTVTVNQLDML